MSSRRHHHTLRTRRTRLAALVAAPITLVAMMGMTTSGAAAADGGTAPVPVAVGLDNPRGVSFSPDGDLYVAEAGTGGPDVEGRCVTSPEEQLTCLGMTGAVTKVSSRGEQSRVLSGLPSLAAAGGGGASGPMDVVAWQQDRLDVAVGLGNDPAVRGYLGDDAALMATLVTAREGDDAVSVISDLGDHEAVANPHTAAFDTNPSSLTRVGGSYVVADAGGNDLLHVTKKGEVSTVAVFPSTPVTVPFPHDMQAVPTAVAVGPDGAYYVSQLTGFPFPVGASTIWRVTPDGERTAFATGLTNVTDLAWERGVLYAVQIADEGLSAPVPPSGSLLAITPGASTHRVVADDLFAPYGVALRHGRAYVSVCSVCAGGGAVVSVPTE